MAVTEATTRPLDAPGAVLTYDVRRGGSADEVSIFLIGSPMTGFGSWRGTSPTARSSRTTRAFERSTKEDPNRVDACTARRRLASGTSRIGSARSRWSSSRATTAESSVASMARAGTGTPSPRSRAITSERRATELRCRGPHRPVRTGCRGRNADPPDRRRGSVEFVETFVQNYPKGHWIIREREWLINAIDRAAGEHRQRREAV
jgi:hypothetical protein